MSITEHHDYRQWLKYEFSERCQRNPMYSLRAFARDLAMQPSHLSDVLNAKQGLSRQSAARIARRLNFPKNQETIFVTAVEATHGRSHARREAAKLTLRDLQKSAAYRTLDEHVFEIISDWHHYAILELAQTEGFVPTFRWIARRLNIPEIQVECAVSRLHAVGLLRAEGKRWVVAEQFPATVSEIPSAAIRKFHTQILEKAARALKQQTVEARDFSCMTFSVNPVDLPLFKAEIKKFRRSLDKKFNSRPNKTEVYALAVQFFALTQKPAKEDRPALSLSEVTNV